MVKYITYKEKKYPIRVSFFAISNFEDETKRKVSEIDDSISLLVPLFWYSFLQGHKVQGKEVEFKRDDMIDILDECYYEFLELIPEFLPKDNGKKGKK